MRLNGFRMYNAGWFPAVVPGEPGESVLIEVMDIGDADDTIRALDRYEGVPFLYRREIVTTPVGEAFIYLFNGETENMSRIESGDWHEQCVPRLDARPDQ